MKSYLQKVLFCDENAWKDGCLEEPSEGILYITDREDCLKRLKERGLPAAAWLHEGNREQDFSAAAYAIEDPQEVEADFYEKIYRREKGIPWEILETERCLVREMMPEDAEAFAAIYREPAVNKYMKDFHGDAEGERKFIEEYQLQYRFCEYGVWSVVLKETGEVIGRVGFSERKENGSGISLSVKNCSEEECAEWLQFGYVIGVPWQGQGLAYEVCSAVLAYASQEWGLGQVCLVAEPENVASLRLAEKLGFGFNI